MTQKKTFEEIQILANAKSHKLISVSNSNTPAAGKLTFYCNKCDQVSTVSARSYIANHEGGCPSCKSINASKRQKGVPKKMTPEQVEKKAREKEYIKANKEKLRKKFEHIKNREDLIQYLKHENNAYTQFILDRLSKPAPEKDKSQNHHIIPLHAGGPDKTWNLIRLTYEDHLTAHKLRYEVYKEPGDKNAINLAGTEQAYLTKPKVESVRRGDATRKLNKIGIYMLLLQVK